MSEPQQVKRRWSWHRFQYGLRYALALAGGLTVAGVGDYMSFRNLMAYARQHHFASDWGLPVGLDAAIPSLLLLDSLRPSRFFRAAAFTLSGITVFANAAVTADHSWVTRGLHGLMPAIAIIWYEAVRRLNRGEVDKSKMDRVRLLRYLVSPVRTVRLRVRMIRWEVTSYSEALRRESAILLARAVLVSEYGRPDWHRTRKAVPVILRHQLDTGQLPFDLLLGPDWQVAVRAWIVEVLDDLDARRHTDRTTQDRTNPDAILDQPDAAPRPWDQIWDRRDELVPRGIDRAVFAQSIGIARDHFEQVGRPISGSRLVGLIGGAKGRANAIAAVLKTAHESGVDQAVAFLDAPQPVRQTAGGPAETDTDPASLPGPPADDRVPAVDPS